MFGLLFESVNQKQVPKQSYVTETSTETKTKLQETHF